MDRTAKVLPPRLPPPPTCIHIYVGTSEMCAEAVGDKLRPEQLYFPRFEVHSHSIRL